MGFRAILPRRYLNAKDLMDNIDDVLVAFAVEAERELKTYPAWRPWKNPPRTGLRAGGKRLGNYGRGWAGYQLKKGREVSLTNAVPYAVFVGGAKDKRPGQTGNMASRGWPSVTDVGKRAAKVAIGKAKLAKR